MSLINKLKCQIKKLFLKELTPEKQFRLDSYSQCGEDLIVDFIFSQYLKIEKPSYLDIGAYHPFHFSNTALMHQNGSRGVCVEPDPYLFKEVKKYRTNDICLNTGIGITDDVVADFFVMTAKTLNTFSKEEAERYQSYGSYNIQEIIKVPLARVNTIIQQNFQAAPDFVSLDVEGMDLQILKDFDFKKYRPKVFCVETLTYTENKEQKKLIEIIDFMISNGYMLYADTYINSIFIDEQTWRK